MRSRTVGKRGANRRLRWLLQVVSFSVVAILALQGVASAATLVKVTPSNPDWTQDDTRGGGTVNWTNAYGAPSQLGTDSLELATGASSVDKAGLYTHTMAGTPLSAVTALSYWTYQASASFVNGAVSFQLQLDTDGTLGDGLGFTTMVYEPYNNGHTIQNGVWEHWNVLAEKMWSSRATACGIQPGFGGPPLYTVQDILALCPSAVVVGIGVNVGSNNPSWVVATDGVVFNDTAYNFENSRRPTTKDDCKRGGWQDFDDPVFKNQGDCVSWVQTGK